MIRDIEEFVLLCNIILTFVFLEIMNLLFSFWGDKYTDHKYSQSDYHLIHLANIHSSFLIYFSCVQFGKNSL